MTYIPTADRMLLQAIADGDITWENNRPENHFEQDYEFVWRGQTVDKATREVLLSLERRDLFVHRVGLPLTDAGRAAISGGGA